MDTTERLALLRQAKSKAAQGGGEKKRKTQPDAALTARARIDALLDEGSFIEIGALVSARNEYTAADGVVTGYGTVDERLVFVYSQDATVMGGAVGEMNADKICKIFDMAAKMGAPIVGMLDSCGARIGEGIEAQNAVAKLFAANARVSGVVPNISLVLGNCAGGAALAASMSDFVIINEKTGRMFVNGPTVIEASTGKKAKVDGKGSFAESGNAHFMGADDNACVEIARLLLSYLPSNNLSDPPVLECTDDLNRTSETLASIEGEYDMRTVIAETADDGAFLEVQSEYAKNAVTGFARFNGASVGIAANQPNTGDGILTGRAIEKIARFVRFCDCFNIPVVTFTDTDGFAVSAAEEEWGLAKKGARMLYAFAEATVPKVNVIVGRAYGSSYAAMNSKQLGADIVLAFPQAEIAPLSSKTGVQLLYEDKLREGKSREELETAYKNIDASPLVAAAAGSVDDVIEPRETRCRIIAALEMLASKRESGVSRKHDNMPL